MTITIVSAVTGEVVLRRPRRRRLLLRMVLPCLVPLTACGAAATPAAPPFQPPAPAPSVPAPAPSPGNAPATTRAGTSSSPAPAEPSPTVVSPPAAPVMTTVVLDPGHNGENESHPAQINRPVPAGRGDTKPCNTTGTSTDAGYAEAAFNWEVALLVRDALATRGVNVVLTRPDNSGFGPCVDDRAATANRAGAVAMVSIHADGARASGHGFHVAYSDPPLNASQGGPSIGLADALVGAMRRGGFSTSDYIGTDGPNPRSDLAGLNLAEVPAALVECANMRNADEAALVSTPAGRARYARAITDGIVAWLVSGGLLQPPSGG